MWYRRENLFAQEKAKGNSAESATDLLMSNTKRTKPGATIHVVYDDDSL